MTETTRKTKGKPDEMDVHVGTRLKTRRSLLGLSQEKLGDAVGLTFQQVQKYEKGVNRISAGKLFQFSQFLGVPVSYFYETVTGKTAGQAYGAADDSDHNLLTPPADQDRDNLKKLMHFYTRTNGDDFKEEIMRYAEKISELSQKK